MWVLWGFNTLSVLCYFGITHIPISPSNCKVNSHAMRACWNVSWCFYREIDKFQAQQLHTAMGDMSRTNRIDKFNQSKTVVQYIALSKVHFRIWPVTLGDSAERCPIVNTICELKNGCRLWFNCTEWSVSELVCLCASRILIYDLATRSHLLLLRFKVSLLCVVKKCANQLRQLKWPAAWKRGRTTGGRTTDNSSINFASVFIFHFLWFGLLPPPINRQFQL